MHIQGSDQSFLNAQAMSAIEQASGTSSSLGEPAAMEVIRPAQACSCSGAGRAPPRRSSSRGGRREDLRAPGALQAVMDYLDNTACFVGPQPNRAFLVALLVLLRSSDYRGSVKEVPAEAVRCSREHPIPVDTVSCIRGAEDTWSTALRRMRT